QLDQPVEPDTLLDFCTFVRCSLVVPEDRGTDHAVGVVERDEPVHLARESDAGDVEITRDLRERSLRGTPPVLRILLRPTRPRGRERIAALRLCEHGTVRRDRDCFDAGRADVDADERLVHAQSSAATATYVSTQRSRLSSDTHSTSAWAPSPHGPKSTVGIPAPWRSAASVQNGKPMRSGSPACRATSSTIRSAASIAN